MVRLRVSYHQNDETLSLNSLRYLPEQSQFTHSGSLVAAGHLRLEMLKRRLVSLRAYVHSCLYQIHNALFDVLEQVEDTAEGDVAGGSHTCLRGIFLKCCCVMGYS